MSRNAAIQNALDGLKAVDKELVLWEHTAAVLEWDQQTSLPKKAVDARADQLSQLMAHIHARMTDPKIGELLDELGASETSPEGSDELSAEERGLVRLYFREYSRNRKLPDRWVREFSEITAKGHAVWAEARQADDFSRFLPALKKIISLNKEKSDILGYSEHPYDPLLDEFEPDMKTSEVERVFSAMKQDIVEVLEKIADQGQVVQDDFLCLGYDKEKLKAFGDAVLTDMGFDFDRGLIGEAAHPFTTSLGPNDIRITTRYNEPTVSSTFYSTIHEGGHALYEMGASAGKLAGTSLGTGASLAMHESQSRMWENMIGRSRAFWEHYYPYFHELFPEQTAGVTADGMVRAVNRVQPSMIRVNADEVTYGLHIILRFELEKALLEGAAAAEDLPELWNEKMRALMGIVPKSHAEGVLQDVHWSGGMIGYFPTYALGNLFAAQIYHTMEKQLGSVDDHVRQGDLASIRTWLAENIHAAGAVFTSTDLLQQVTGEQLNPAYFTDYVKLKYLKQ